MKYMRKTVVVSYSLEGKKLETYKTAKEASEVNHVHPRSIDKCIRKERETVKGKIWRRYLLDEVPEYISVSKKEVQRKRHTSIAEIDEDNNIINIYPSIRQASLVNKVDSHTIRDVLQGKTRTAKGKRYRYLG